MGQIPTQPGDDYKQKGGYSGMGKIKQKTPLRRAAEDEAFRANGSAEDAESARNIYFAGFLDGADWMKRYTADRAYQADVEVMEDTTL